MEAIEKHIRERIKKLEEQQANATKTQEGAVLEPNSLKYMVAQNTGLMVVLAISELERCLTVLELPIKEE